MRKSLKSRPDVAVIEPTAEQLALARGAYLRWLREPGEDRFYVAFITWWNMLLLACTVHTRTGAPFFEDATDCIRRFNDPVTLEAALTLAGLLTERGTLPPTA